MIHWRTIWVILFLSVLLWPGWAEEKDGVQENPVAGQAWEAKERSLGFYAFHGEEKEAMEYRLGWIFPTIRKLELGLVSNQVFSFRRKRGGIRNLKGGINLYIPEDSLDRKKCFQRYVPHTFMDEGDFVVPAGESVCFKRGDLQSWYDYCQGAAKIASAPDNGKPLIDAFQLGTELGGYYWPNKVPGSVEDAAIMLRLGYRAIKSVNPNATVVLPGSDSPRRDWRDPPAGDSNDMRIGYYVRILRELEYMETLEKNLSKDSKVKKKEKNKYLDHPEISKEEYELLFSPDQNPFYFDAIDLHPIGDEKRDGVYFEEVDLVYKQLNKLGYSKMPLYLTDVNDLGLYRDGDEDRHARILAKRYIQARASGAVCFCWTIFRDAPSDYKGTGADNIGKYSGIIKSDGIPKKAAFTWKMLAEKLDSKLTVDRIIIKEDREVQIWKFSDKGDNPIYVAWRNGDKKKDISFEVGFNGKKASITPLVSSDLKGSFVTSSVKMSGRFVNIVLTSEPCCIEKE